MTKIIYYIHFFRMLQYEPVCRGNTGDDKGHFCFFYATIFIEIGLRLPLDIFEKKS